MKKRNLLILMALLLTAGCGSSTGDRAGGETGPAATEAPKELPVAGVAGVAEAALTESAQASGEETAVPAPAEEAPLEAEIQAEPDFSISEIPDEIWEKIQGKSYGEGCPVAREELRYLTVLHVDAAGETHPGEMIVNAQIAEDVLEILRELYQAGYPIEKIRLVEEYGADDETSMEDNNSSCFNYRPITGSTRISRHGLGLAVDINPLYNPCTRVVDGERICEPANGWDYLDREADFPYKITEGDLCWQLFTERGFTWGGSWTSVKDYQHFEISG